jgi:hypothetical protein
MDGYGNDNDDGCEVTTISHSPHGPYVQVSEKPNIFIYFHISYDIRWMPPHDKLKIGPFGKFKKSYSYLTPLNC